LIFNDRMNVILPSWSIPVRRRWNECETGKKSLKFCKKKRPTNATWQWYCY